MTLKKHRWLFVLGALLGLALVFGPACKSKTASERTAEKAMARAIEQATGGKATVDLKEGRAKIASARGTTEFDAGAKEWPADLPEDVPPFTLGKVRGVNRHEEEGKKTWNVILQNIEDGAVEKYVETLRSKDWTIDQTTSMGEGGMIAATKDKLRIIAMFSKKDKAGSVAVSTDNEE